jgi:hypothetical protein
MNGPQLSFAATWREPNTRLFRDSLLGNMPTRLEAFPDAILETRRHFLKPSGLGTGTFAPQHSCTFGEHASVFTQGSDLPWNLQALFCFQSTTELFLQRSKKVEMLPARAGSKHAFPHGLKHPGLRRAEAQAPVK